jgi:hypothetical protein
MFTSGKIQAAFFWLTDLIKKGGVYVLTETQEGEYSGVVGRASGH